jgi:hypothetical protein
MESLETIRKVVEETLERKLAEALPTGLKFPLPVFDHIRIKGKRVRVVLEIYEDTVVAYLAQDRDIFAEGPTVQKAKAMLLSSIQDEYEFLSRHRKELSKELKGKLAFLRRIIG